MVGQTHLHLHLTLQLKFHPVVKMMEALFHAQVLDQMTCNGFVVTLKKILLARARDLTIKYLIEIQSNNHRMLE